MGDYVDSHGIGRNFTPAQLGREQVNAAIDWYDEHADDWAWDQLSRVHDYLQSRTDLAYLDLYHNGESAGLYEEWQTRGDAMWLVRDCLKGRDPLIGQRTITTIESIVARENAAGGKEEL